MNLTAMESRRELGWVDPLDTFLSREHTLAQRLRIAVEAGTTTIRLEGLIAGCHSKDPARELLCRLNLNLTLNGAGPRTTMADRFQAALGSSGSSMDAFMDAVREAKDGRP